MQYARAAGAERRRMAAGFNAVPGGLDADHRHLGIADEGIEQADGVRAAPDASHQGIGKPPGLSQHLIPGFPADDGLKVPHHGRIGMWASDGADDVERVIDIRDPIAHRLIEGVLKGFRTRGYRHHLGAQQPHAQHIGRLPGHVDLAHVNHALEPQAGCHGRCGHAMLAGAGFGDDAGLAHALG